MSKQNIYDNETFFSVNKKSSRNSGRKRNPVRPSERGKGYAKGMLRLNFQNAKRNGIDKILVTCHSNSAASKKTIIANCGIFEKTIEIDGNSIKK